MIALPNECLFEIFIHLNKEDLFSCLLVNRRWCRHAVPTLWRKLTTFKSRKLITTCLLSLNTEEQTLLLPFNIALPKGPKPLFKYTTFTKAVYFDTDSGIIDWLDRERYDSHELVHRSPNTKEDKSSINVSHAIASSLITMFLRTSTNLKDLRICDIGYNQMINLSENLYKGTALNFMGFVNNKLGSEGGKEIALTLCKNTTLTYLYIGNNQLGVEGGIALSEALCINNTLTHLNLWNCQLGSDGGKALANALCQNNTLIYLNIGNNQLGLDGGKALAKALYRNTTLTHLSVYNNKLGFAGGEKFAKMLCKNTTLTYLNIGSNQLGSIGGKAFADALCKNVTLTFLDLRDNSLEIETGQDLVDGLCENTTLTYLCLYNNSICDTLLTVIDDLLKNNRKQISEYCKDKSQFTDISLYGIRSY